jgi:ABC-2 type transport system permease protein
MTTLASSWHLAVRQMRIFYRQPVWIGIALAQPVIWLLLYGALFAKIVQIPGFGGGSYLNYLVPGIVVMNALFNSGWSGMTLCDDIGLGLLDRFLITPVPRRAVIAGRLIHVAAAVIIQSAVLLGLGFAIGARFPDAGGGLVVLVCCSILLGTGIGALSGAAALELRRPEGVLAIGNFVLLPLTFLSSVFIRQSLAPGWIQAVSRFNPVNWTVQAGRAALGGNTDWAFVLERVGMLAVFTAACAWLASRAFRSYRRAI